jgi:LysR family tdc operon transcriptional activator
MRELHVQVPSDGPTARAVSSAMQVLILSRRRAGETICRSYDPFDFVNGAERFMNINQLRYFVTIVENRSFRAASDLLNVSQPALSNSIKSLEDILQVTLFDRGKNGVFPTPYGKVLYQFFKSALQSVERGNQEVEVMREGSTGHVNVGAPTGMIDLFLPKIIERVNAIQPGITFGVHYGYLDKLLQTLRHGELDFLLSPYWPDTSSANDLEIEKLTELFVSIYARSTHPLARKKNVSLDDLMGAKWIFAESEGMKSFRRALFGDISGKLNNCLMTHNYPPFMANILKELDLLTLIPDYIAAEMVDSGDLKKIRYARFRPTLSAGLIRLTGRHLTPSMQLFLDQTRKFMRAV